MLPNACPKRAYVKNRTHVCAHCGVEFKRHGRIPRKFCSVKCYRSIVQARPAFVEVACAKCGVKFHRTRAAVARVKNVFCSSKCSGEFNSGLNHPHFRGNSDPGRGAKWNRLKDEIRKRDNYTCRRCGRCEYGCLKKLSIDHVRPWRSFDDKALANHPDNLVALCGSCHSFKTTVIEAAWLRGDVLAWKQWVASLHMESAVKFGWVG